MEHKLNEEEVLVGNKSNASAIVCNDYPIPSRYASTQDLLQNFFLEDGEVINLYMYGSRVYGTAREDSDYETYFTNSTDFIIIVKDENISSWRKRFDEQNSEVFVSKRRVAYLGNVNIDTIGEEEEGDNQILGRNGDDATILSETDFQDQRRLALHHPNVLECVFLPSSKIILHRKVYPVAIDITQLRKSFSALVANSYSKAGKKIEIEKDYKRGQKGLFQALRILENGIQLASEGRISDYTKANHFWPKIVELGMVPWSDYHTFVKPHWNALKSQFRLAAPKKTQNK